MLFAALTSAISLAETCASTFEDELKWSRKKATTVVALIVAVLGSLSSLGFGPLFGVTPLGMSILDFFDFLTNSLMMPVAAFVICIFAVYVVGVRKISEEVHLSSRFRFEGMYRICLKYIAPFFVMVILLSSIANVLGIITI